MTWSGLSSFSFIYASGLFFSFLTYETGLLCRLAATSSYTLTRLMVGGFATTLSTLFKGIGCLVWTDFTLAAGFFTSSIISLTFWTLSFTFWTTSISKGIYRCFSSSTLLSLSIFCFNKISFETGLVSCSFRFSFSSLTIGGTLFSSSMINI